MLLPNTLPHLLAHTPFSVQNDYATANAQQSESHSPERTTRSRAFAVACWRLGDDQVHTCGCGERRTQELRAWRAWTTVASWPSPLRAVVVALGWSMHTTLDLLLSWSTPEKKAFSEFLCFIKKWSNFVIGAVMLETGTEGKRGNVRELTNHGTYSGGVTPFTLNSYACPTWRKISGQLQQRRQQCNRERQDWKCLVFPQIGNRSVTPESLENRKLWFYFYFTKEVSTGWITCVAK